jgi:regulator of cell morphogenesis and NO signaling
MSEFNTTQTIGDIVSAMPKASEVFKKFNIDFCCGGHRPLADAIKEQGLNETDVLKKLNEAYQETKQLNSQEDFRNMPSGQLIDYIVNKHHAFLNKNLPAISQLSTIILRVHGPHHSELFDVHKLFHSLKADLEQHLIKEETLLFPMIKEYEKNPSDELLQKIRKVTKETEEEHESAGGILKDLRKVTKEYYIPDDVCETLEKTYEMLKATEADLFEHIHLENNILFKRLGIVVH